MDVTNPNFPKILIIGTPFDKNTGGGITMSNLFKGWPKDRLALISNTNLQNNLDNSICEKYFQLGYHGKLHPFPLGIVLPRIKIGAVDKLQPENENLHTNKGNPGKYKTIYKYLNWALHFVGLKNAIYKLEISTELKDWIIDFDPDFIYSQLSTLELIRFVTDVHNVIGKPVVIHMMDDWPVTINKPGLLSYYWGKTIDKEFRELLNKSSVLMSICEAMSIEYGIRYNKNFIPFHNPIETANWLPFARNNWDIKEKFTILYAGRIGNGVKNSIVDIVDAVNDPRLLKTDLVLELQTADISALRKMIKFTDRVKWIKPIKYSDLPAKFAGADLLVLPHDFDKNSVNFLRFSFSTKVTEYMISGTPVLVYADNQTALAKYALNEKWAYVVTERSKESLVKAIVELVSDFNLRRNLGERAKSLALKNEDSTIVRDRFRKSFELNINKE